MYYYLPFVGRNFILMLDNDEYYPVFYSISWTLKNIDPYTFQVIQKTTLIKIASFWLIDFFPLIEKEDYNFIIIFQI